MAEYVIILLVVALAALAIFGIFSDTLRSKLGGAVEELGGDQDKVDAALQKSSQDTLKEIKASTDSGGNTTP